MENAALSQPFKMISRYPLVGVLKTLADED